MLCLESRGRQYQDKPAWNFFSPRMGYAQRLPNGNTLITESEGDEHGGYVRNRLPLAGGAFFIERTRLRMMCVRTDLCSYVRAPANGSRSVQKL
jgi:hypothetical protein